MSANQIELLGTLRADGPEAVVTFDRPYATAPADLWQAVTTPERLDRWFARVRGDLTPGGAFTIAFDDGDVPECRVETCDAPTSFTWTWPHEGHTSHIEVTVLADGEGSRLRLVHSRLPMDKAPEYGAGWQAYFRSLDAYLDGVEDTFTGAWWQEFHTLKDAYAQSLPTGVQDAAASEAT